jgi:hypothetical protein
VAWVRLIMLAAGFVLLLSAIAKVTRPAGFRSRVAAYAGRIQWLAAFAANGILLAEACLALLLLSGRVPALGLLGSAGLFGAFAVVNWGEYLKRRGKSDPAVDCGCLGAFLKLRMGRQAAVLNSVVAFALAASAVAVIAVADAQPQLADSGVQDLWPSALLLAMLFWLMHYAFAVLGRMNDEVVEL